METFLVLSKFKTMTMVASEWKYGWLIGNDTVMQLSAIQVQ